MTTIEIQLKGKLKFEVISILFKDFYFYNLSGKKIVFKRGKLFLFALCFSR
jgi:hypothetical protein